MKQLTVMLLCLLLCGCARQTSSPPPETVPPIREAAAMAGLYDPDHPMEKAYPGQVRAYPLTLQKVRGIYTLGNDVLALSGRENTTLTLFTGDELREAASLELGFPLPPEDTSLRVHPKGLSYFDPTARQTVVLDHRLQEVRRIAAPEGLSGKPILSSRGDVLYYCTGWSVMAWDLDSGIRRTLKEISCEEQELTALHWEDRILECRIRQGERTTKVLLSADQGLEQGSLPENASIHWGDQHFFAAVPRGYQTLLIFGKPQCPPELLLPEDLWQQQFYLPQDHAAVTLHATKTGNELDYYELNTGHLRASLILDPLQTPKAMANSKGHSVYILAHDAAADQDILYRWDVLRQAPDPSNVTSRKTEYSVEDTAALEACLDYAKAIGEKYGIHVLVGDEAVALQPWDYRFTAETLAPVVQKELTLLDQRLSQYPPSVLQQTKAHFSDLTVCLVQQITGTKDDRSLSTATGIQFFQDDRAYVVITAGKYSEQALYHELYHVMETHLLTESTALDQWDALNPAGFAYGTLPENPDIYLQGQTRAFVDRYSMSASKEDRARVLENAMLQEKGEVFQSEYMQRKLSALGRSFREAYGLKDHPHALPWEQYLVNPLTPKS